MRSISLLLNLTYAHEFSAQLLGRQSNPPSPNLLRRYVGYPKRIEAIRAARIKASARASLAVLSSGKVFVWGCSKNGELGFGDTSTRPAPHNVNTPSNIPFTDVAFGSHHVLAVNRRGELYGWGKNGQGQLGLAYNTRTELKQVCEREARTEYIHGLLLFAVGGGVAS
jgi:alpha-tubulin suppressor-like RCC1 family protein